MIRIVSQFLGILLLVQAACCQETTPISQVTKDKVGETLTITGNVVSVSPPTSDRAPYSLKVGDVTGQLRLAIWRDAFDTIAGKDMLTQGTTVTATIRVQEFKGKVEGTVGSGSDLVIKGAGAPQAAAPVASSPASTTPANPAGTPMPIAGLPSANTTVAQITPDKKDSNVSINGTVQSFSPSRSDRAPFSFTVNDATGSIRVAVWPDEFNNVAQKDAIKPGAHIHVAGKLVEFRNKLELHPDSAADITVAAAATSATAPVTPPSTAVSISASTPPASPGSISSISALTRDKLNETFTISGKVASARAPSSDRAPYILKVSDASGSINVVFWSDIATQLSPAQKADVGDNIQVAGQLKDFRGTLQLQPGEAADIKTGKNNPDLFSASDTTATSAPQAAAAHELKTSDVAAAALSERVKISGEITAIERVRTGKRITLKDPSGSVDVLVWDTAEGLRPEVRKVHPSSHLTVAGAIQDISGKRTIVVKKPEDILEVQP
jgi:DNA/RNA endonuclease YhcR with UshA esterase domain